MPGRGSGAEYKHLKLGDVIRDVTLSISTLTLPSPCKKEGMRVVLLRPTCIWSVIRDTLGRVSEPIRRRIRFTALGIVLLLASASFFTGIQWGLPSREADPFLFGDKTPWTGAEIVALAPKAADDRGADVDANPIADRQHTVVLNETDVQRAEIVRRYRLFSNQPDEMITFMSLSRIRENSGDPRLYQYGGLWIYPVGALIKVVLNPKADQAFYLDHPEAFAKFYVVARVYSALFGIAGAWAVYWIVRRLSGGILIPLASALCFAMLPVVVNLSHEAKPHLAGTVLMLLAIIAASKFVETGRTRFAVLSGALCGAAFGMIISALVAFSIPFVMIALRWDASRRRASVLGAALAAGVAVYAVTNPFVLINSIARPERFKSNLQNSTAMYSTGTTGLGNAIGLIIEGASPLVVAVGIAGATFLFAQRLARRQGAPVGGLLEVSVEGDVGWLLFVPATLVTAMFVVLASRKPPEYARFALLVDVALVVAAFAALGRVKNTLPRAIMAVTLLVFTGVCAWPYWVGFVRDCAPMSSRYVAAKDVKQFTDVGARTLRLSSEPAPYCVPPVDLFKTKLLLAPPGSSGSADVVVSLDPMHARNPMSWADVGFVVVSPMGRLRQWHPATTTNENAGVDSATRPNSATTVSSP